MLNLNRNRIVEEMKQEDLYALRALREPKAGKILAKWLLAIGIIFLIVLFLPWQQNIKGTGKVTAFNPENRPQTVEAVIAGRIKEWYVREGNFVSKGDTIATLTEVKDKYFDPELIDRLQDQINAKESGVNSKGEKVNALRRQIVALRSGMELKVKQSQNKVEAEAVRFKNAENQFVRNKKLYEAGNLALTKYQELEYKYQGAQADYLIAQSELERVRAEYMDKISKAESDVSSTLSDQFESIAEIAKLKNELVNMTIRNNQYQIIAPQSGTIVKAVKSGLGETIKEGDAICTIMPQQSDLAVEFYVKAMDVPLISRGRKTRIIFDGWPALQFSGWPSVSVGSFGGTVEVIDLVNTKPGEFRVLVVPDKDDEAWPRQLRNGSGIKGWVMLDDVPVWYELWRQLNGFPPSLYKEPLHIEDEPKQNEKSK